MVLPLWAATGGVAVLATGVEFAPIFVVTESVMAVLVVLLGGRRRWRLFLVWAPVAWLLMALLVAAVADGRRLGSIGLILLVAAPQLPRLVDCTVPRGLHVRAITTRALHLIALVLTGLVCGAIYAWLLASGTVDAWDVDVRRQTVYQPAGQPLRLGLESGLATAWVAVLAQLFVPEAPQPRPGHPPGSGRWPLAGALAAALVFAWAFRLLIAVSVDGMAATGGSSAGVACWALATPAAAAAWVVLSWWIPATTETADGAGTRGQQPAPTLPR